MDGVQADVCVVGAGMTGIAAALAAARHGAETVLVEWRNYLGGTPASGQGFVGWYDDHGRLLVRGIPLEVVQRLCDMGGATGIIEEPINNGLVAVDPHLYQICIANMLREAGVHVLLYSQAVDVLKDSQNVVRGIIVQARASRHVLHSRITIDASGDGDVCALARVPFTYGGDLSTSTQAASVPLRLGHIDWQRFVAFVTAQGGKARHLLVQEPERLARWLTFIQDAPAFIISGFEDIVHEARRRGEWQTTDARIVGCAQPCFDTLVLVSSRVYLQNVSSEDLTWAELEGLAHAHSVYEVVRRYVPGLENARIIGIGPSVGIRESRHIRGDYMLTGEDVLAGCRFPDTIALSGYQMSVHVGADIASARVPVYGIPYRCLLPAGVENLLMAGRCISATHEAHASIRCVPVMATTGQAAGTAAALACRFGLSPRRLNVEDIQQEMIADGCELGQGLHSA